MKIMRYAWPVTQPENARFQLKISSLAWTRRMTGLLADWDEASFYAMNPDRREPWVRGLHRRRGVHWHTLYRAMDEIAKEYGIHQQVTDLHIAFGQIATLMPDRQQLREYKEGWGSALFSALFFNAGRVDHLVPKAGIDPVKAIRHIRAIMGSYEPKHEDKEAAVGYLFELWFEEPNQTAGVCSP